MNTVYVENRLTKHQRDVITGAAKWLERIVIRRDDLPASFLDNTNPSSLVKELRSMLSDNTGANDAKP